MHSFGSRCSITLPFVRIALSCKACWVKEYCMVLYCTQFDKVTSRNDASSLISACPVHDHLFSQPPVEKLWLKDFFQNYKTPIILTVLSWTSLMLKYRKLTVSSKPIFKDFGMIASRAGPFARLCYGI